MSNFEGQRPVHPFAEPEFWFQKGKDFIARATEEDQNENYAEAIKYYEHAVECFKEIENCKVVPTKRFRESNQMNCVIFMDRSELLKKYLKGREKYFADIKKAFTMVSRAVEKDCEKNYEEAVELYEHGLEYFWKAECEVRTHYVTNRLWKTYDKYMDRAEEIKEYLYEQQKKNHGIEDVIDSLAKVFKENEQENSEETDQSTCIFSF